MSLDQLGGNLELPEGVDLPLRVAPQGGVGAPHHVVRAEIAEQRAQHVGALERAVRHGGGERGADLGVEVLALRLEALEGGQLVLVRPRRVIGDEVEVEEIVAHGVQVLGMGVARHELPERNALVAADVLDAELARLLPDRVRQLLIVEPPPALLGRVERVELEAGDLVLLHEHRQPLQRLRQPLVRREPAAQHHRPGGPAPLDLGLLLDGDHVLAAVVLAEAERVEDRDAGVATLQDQLAEVFDGHVLGAVGQAHRLAEVVEELDEPHAALARVDAGDVAVLPRADVGVGVDDEVLSRLPVDLDLLGRRRLVGLGLGDVEEPHAGDLVDGQHRRRQRRRGAQKTAPRQAAPGRRGVDVLADLRSQVSAEEERRPLLFGRPGTARRTLVTFEVFEDVELHDRSPPTRPVREMLDQIPAPVTPSPNRMAAM